MPASPSPFFDPGILFSIVPLFFILVLAVIVYAFVKNAREWSRNNKQPVIPTPAKVVAKRQSHFSRSAEAHHHHGSTSYYVTFELVNGERIELSVTGSQYGMLAEGDQGVLSLQGSRFIDFARD